jgi:hypothetical protein
MSQKPITNTHHPRSPHALTQYRGNAWELQMQPHAARWHRSRVGDLFIMIFVEVRPVSDVRVELPRTNDAKPSDLQPRPGDIVLNDRCLPSRHCSQAPHSQRLHPASLLQRQQDIYSALSNFPPTVGRLHRFLYAMQVVCKYRVLRLRRFVYTQRESQKPQRLWHLQARLSKRKDIYQGYGKSSSHAVGVGRLRRRHLWGVF